MGVKSRLTDKQYCKYWYLFVGARFPMVFNTEVDLTLYIYYGGFGCTRNSSLVEIRKCHNSIIAVWVSILLNNHRVSVSFPLIISSTCFFEAKFICFRRIYSKNNTTSWPIVRINYWTSLSSFKKVVICMNFD